MVGACLRAWGGARSEGGVSGVREGRFLSPWAEGEGSDCTNSLRGRAGPEQPTGGRLDTTSSSRHWSSWAVGQHEAAFAKPQGPRPRRAAPSATSGPSSPPWSQWFPPTGGARREGPGSRLRALPGRGARGGGGGLVEAGAWAAAASARERREGRKVLGYVRGPWRPRGPGRAPAREPSPSAARFVCGLPRGARPAPRWPRAGGGERGRAAGRARARAGSPFGQQTGFRGGRCLSPAAGGPPASSCEHPPPSPRCCPRCERGVTLCQLVSSSWSSLQPAASSTFRQPERFTGWFPISSQSLQNKPPE